MQAMAMSNSPSQRPTGTGGFLDPDIIVTGFGIEKGMKVADFGCGAGYFTISLATKTGPEGRVYALDVQESALDSVRARARSHNLDNIETIRTNLEVAGSSSLGDGSQDIVLLANILFQSNKKSDIIQEAKRILKIGSEMIIIDWKKGAGGFGPPDDLRLDYEEIRKLAEKNSLLFKRDIDAGQFHFGLMLKK